MKLLIYLLLVSELTRCNALDTFTNSKMYIIVETQQTYTNNDKHNIIDTSTPISTIMYTPQPLIYQRCKHLTHLQYTYILHIYTRIRHL